MSNFEEPPFPDFDDPAFAEAALREERRRKRRLPADGAPAKASLGKEAGLGASSPSGTAAPRARRTIAAAAAAPAASTSASLPLRSLGRPQTSAAGGSPVPEKRMAFQSARLWGRAAGGRAEAAAPRSAVWPAEPLWRRSQDAAAAPSAQTAPAPQPALPAVITVAALAGLIAERIEGLAAGIWIRGEVASCRFYRGTAYFELKDEAAPGAALLKCVIWQSAQLRSSSPPPALGDKLEVQGEVSFYKARGEAQISVQAWRRAGLGELYEQFLKLKAKLQAEGLFDAARKKPIPRFVKRAAIVTSPQAAALQDVLRTIRRRTPWMELILVHAPVQGADAPARLARALAKADGLRADAVLLVRGGGSYEDLQAFNSELVARAIARMRTPVISGVGHESDETIADYAADLRASTPTAAAEHLSPDLAYWTARLAGAEAQTLGTALRSIEELHQRLDRAGMMLPARSRLLEPQRSLLALAAKHLDREWRAARDAKALRLAAAAKVVRSPEERLGALERHAADAAQRVFSETAASLQSAAARLCLASVQLPKPADAAMRLNERLAAAQKALDREWRAAEDAQTLRLAAAARFVRAPEERLQALAHQAAAAAEKLFAGAGASAAAADARLSLAAARLPPAEQFIARLDERLGRLSAELESFNPDRPLAAGYVRAFSGGLPVTAAASLSVGERLSLRFADGEASVQVERVSPRAAHDNP